MKKTLTTFTACCLYLCSISTAFADANGRSIAVTCSGCHGTDGLSKGSIPTIQGLPVKYIQETLTAFRDGTRKGSIMPRIARGYSDAEIKSLAEYYGAFE